MVPLQRLEKGWVVPCHLGTVPHHTPSRLSRQARSVHLWELCRNPSLFCLKYLHLNKYLAGSSQLFSELFALKIHFDIMHKHRRDIYLALTFVRFLLKEIWWHTNGTELFIGPRGNQSCFYPYWKCIRRQESAKLALASLRGNPARPKGAY
jgi:hypothetical protein